MSPISHPTNLLILIDSEALDLLAKLDQLQVAGNVAIDKRQGPGGSSASGSRISVSDFPAQVRSLSVFEEELLKQ